MKGFSIIIVTWNGLHHLQKFLPSVVATNYSDFEIILADNNSNDGSKEWVAQHYPLIKIAAFDENHGYTGGNNRAVSFSEKEILLFLNNDVQVDPDWLTGINQMFESDDNIASVQPKLLSYNEPEYFEYAGAAGGYLDRFGYPFCRGRILFTNEKDEGQYNSPVQIAWASGAALAIKKDVFNSLGGFDEDFEFHMEEIDLCWRVRNLGFKIMFTPDSKVYHLGGGSLPMGSTRKVYYNFRNSLFMLWKNLPATQLWYKLFLRMVLDGIAAIRSLLGGRSAEFGIIIKAHFHFWRAVPSLHKKRRSVRRDASVKVLSPVLIIWQYFIRKKKKFSDFMP